MAVSKSKALKLLRKKLANAPPVFSIDSFLFKEQLDFVKESHRFATAVCSVRAGKTTACAADLVDTALRLSGSVGLYITLARSSAKRIIWPELLRLNKEYRLGAKSNGHELSLHFPNGSIIYCSGASNDSEIEKFRGLSNVALVYLDECQAFRSHIKELVEDIIVKRLYDLNGRLRLIGTPGLIPSGYFYECSQSAEWAHHAWTLHANPWIQKKSGMTVEALIQQDMRRKGVGIEDPSIQRECFGRWVLDINSLLLEYNPTKNHFDTLPIGNYTYILGIDLGFDDSDSLSVLAWADNSPITYLVKEVVTAKQNIEDLNKQVASLCREYPVCKMVADAGGLGKKIIEELKLRYTIPLEAADKTGKIANYALLNNALRTGNFMAKSSSIFAQDCNLLEKDRNKSTPERIVVKGHSDAVDSVLYAFRVSPAYAYTPPALKPVLGSPEWARDEEERMRQMLYEQIKREQDEMSGYADPFGLGADVNLDKWKRS